jgi:hypothetical protein
MKSPRRQFLHLAAGAAAAGLSNCVTWGYGGTVARPKGT